MKKIYIILIFAFTNSFLKAQELSIVEINSLLNLTEYDFNSNDRKLDVVENRSYYSEYLEWGMLSFATQKEIKPYLDSLCKEWGKPKFKKGSFYAYWKNVNFHGSKNCTIYLDTNHSDKIQNINELTLIIFDKNKQLLSDKILLTKEKERINRIVFSQVEKSDISVKRKQRNIKENIRYFENNMLPINFDSVMILMSNAGLKDSIFYKLTYKALVSKTGKFIKGKLSTDSVSPIFDSKFFNKYVQMFRFNSLDSCKAYLTYFDFENPQRLLKNWQYIQDNVNYFVVNQLDIDTLGFEYFNKSDSIIIGNNQFGMIYYDSKNVRFLLSENKRWILKQTISLTLKGEFLINDINKDGFVDIINFSGRNMNGNQWADLYLFNSDKVEYEKSNQNIFIGEFDNDSCWVENKNYKVKNGYLIAEYSGSWYMPHTYTVYKWIDYKLIPQLIIGEELVFRSMTKDDTPITFIYKLIDNKLTITNQQNQYVKKLPIGEKQINTFEVLKPYLGN
ncbi:MAG: hypothetical protein RLZZ175_1974 [Bacteroidota bacterium]|jgi:hypothetical protein